MPEATKSERLARLFEVAEGLTQAHLSSLVGTRQLVLIEGASKSGGRVEGRTERNEIVHVDAPPGVEITGAIVLVTISRANKHSLEGSVTEDALAELPRRAGSTPARTERRALQVLAEERR